MGNVRSALFEKDAAEADTEADDSPIPLTVSVGEPTASSLYEGYRTKKSR